MSCADGRGKLELYVEGELPPGEAARLGGHLRECASCQALRADIEGGRALLSDLAADDLDAADLAAVRAAVRKRLAEPKTSWPLWKLLLPVAAAASVLVALGLLSRNWWSQPTQPPRVATVTEVPASPAPPVPVAEPSRPPTAPTVRAHPRATRVRRTPERPAVAAPPLTRQAPPEESRPEAASPAAGEEASSEPAEPAGPRPVMVKLFTDDPKITIYWILEENGGKS